VGKAVEQQHTTEIRTPVKEGNAALVEEILARGLARLVAAESQNAVVQSTQASTKAA
jgi:hypothetical protein